MSKDIVELEMDEDGAYAPKDTVKVRKGNKTAAQKNRDRFHSTEKPKYMLENHADEFLGGIDLGLDFIEKVVPRVERLLRLRG